MRVRPAQPLTKISYIHWKHYPMFWYLWQAKGIYVPHEKINTPKRNLQKIYNIKKPLSPCLYCKFTSAVPLSS